MMINSFEINIFRDSSDQYFECKYFQENPTIKFNKKTVLLICDRQGIGFQKIVTYHIFSLWSSNVT